MTLRGRYCHEACFETKVNHDSNKAKTTARGERNQPQTTKGSVTRIDDKSASDAYDNKGEGKERTCFVSLRLQRV